MHRRILADAILFFSIFFAPFWLWSILALIFAFLFDDYYELAFAFLLADLLYATPLERYGGHLFIGLIISSAALIIIGILRKKILHYGRLF